MKHCHCLNLWILINLALIYQDFTWVHHSNRSRGSVEHWNTKTIVSWPCHSRKVIIAEVSTWAEWLWKIYLRLMPGGFHFNSIISPMICSHSTYVGCTDVMNWLTLEAASSVLTGLTRTRKTDLNGRAWNGLLFFALWRTSSYMLTVFWRMRRGSRRSFMLWSVSVSGSGSSLQKTGAPWLSLRRNLASFVSLRPAYCARSAWMSEWVREERERHITCFLISHCNFVNVERSGCG